MRERERERGTSRLGKERFRKKKRRQRPQRSCKKHTRKFSSIISTNREARFQAPKIDNRREYFLFNGNECYSRERLHFSASSTFVLYREESAKNVIGFACESGSLPIFLNGDKDRLKRKVLRDEKNGLFDYVEGNYLA